MWIRIKHLDMTRLLIYVYESFDMIKRSDRITEDIVNSLFQAMQNPTKLSIILLLLQHGRMTVTQMAKHINVSRANLYHFVQELQNEGILTKPESIVRGNYVEKYYKLNSPIDYAGSEIQDRITEANPEEMRNLTSSFLLSLSLQLRLYAEQVSKASTEELLNLLDVIKNERMLLTFYLLSDEKYEYIVSEIKKILEDANKSFRDGEKKMITDQNASRLILVALPNKLFEKTKRNYVENQ
jgi:DNA-binding transcriptional ArsR family regulator